MSECTHKNEANMVHISKHTSKKAHHTSNNKEDIQHSLYLPILPCDFHVQPTLKVSSVLVVQQQQNSQGKFLPHVKYTKISTYKKDNFTTTVTDAMNKDLKG